MKKNLVLVIALVVLVGAGAFYGGTKYAQSSNVSSNVFSAEGRQNFQARGQRSFGGPNGSGANFTNGEIIAKDEQSITVKLRDGGSKIVFLVPSTQVSKMAEGSLDDLTIGTDVTVNGTANDDGSLTAQTVQIRPVMEGGEAGDDKAATDDKN